MVENVKELLKLHEGIIHEVYLDNENSSIVPQEVVDAMLPYWNKKAYGNPTLTHKPGWEAFETLMGCFSKVSRYMGAKNLEEITFHTRRNRSQQPRHHGQLLCTERQRQKNRHQRNRTHQRPASRRDDEQIRLHHTKNSR